MSVPPAATSISSRTTWRSTRGRSPSVATSPRGNAPASAANITTSQSSTQPSLPSSSPNPRPLSSPLQPSPSPPPSSPYSLSSLSSPVPSLPSPLLLPPLPLCSLASLSLKFIGDRCSVVSFCLSSLALLPPRLPPYQPTNQQPSQPNLTASKLLYMSPYMLSLSLSFALVFSLLLFYKRGTYTCFPRPPIGRTGLPNILRQSPQASYSPSSASFFPSQL